jgi:hypothetical protein
MDTFFSLPLLAITFDGGRSLQRREGWASNLGVSGWKQDHRRTIMCGG